MTIYNYEKRQKILNDYLKTLNDIEVNDRNIIVLKEELVFQFHMFQTNIDVFLSECFQCPLDCNKLIELYLGKADLEGENITELEKEDLVLLAHIKDVTNDQLPLDKETIQVKLKRKIFILNFGLIGFDQVGKTTLFEMLSGKSKKVEDLINTHKKEITAFPPLIINLFDYGGAVMENLSSNSPAPFLLEKLRNFYLYIVVTDSTPQNVTATKQMIIPKLKKLSPYAAIIIIANKQDESGRLSPDLIEKIIGERTYPLSAINRVSKDLFNKLLNEIILLRREQIQEYECPFLETRNNKKLDS